MVFSGWGTSGWGEAGGSSCVTEKVIEYFQYSTIWQEKYDVAEVKLTKELQYFGLHVGPPPSFSPLLVEIVMMYTSNHVSSSMFHASSKPIYKKE